MTEHEPALAGIARRTTLSVVAVATTASGTAAAQAGHGGGMGGGAFGFGGLAGLFWMALLIAVPLLFVYALTNRGSGDRSGGGATRDGDDALSVLRERYARGNLSEEEFERRRNRLR